MTCIKPLLALLDSNQSSKYHLSSLRHASKISSAISPISCSPWLNKSRTSWQIPSLFMTSQIPSQARIKNSSVPSRSSILKSASAETCCSSAGNSAHFLYAKSPRLRETYYSANITTESVWGVKRTARSPLTRLWRTKPPALLIRFHSFSCVYKTEVQHKVAAISYLSGFVIKRHGYRLPIFGQYTSRITLQK